VTFACVEIGRSEGSGFGSHSGGRCRVVHCRREKSYKVVIKSTNEFRFEVQFPRGGPGIVDGSNHSGEAIVISFRYGPAKMNWRTPPSA
jgi:hypothetical protein